MLYHDINPEIDIIEDFLNDHQEDEFCVFVHFLGSGDSGDVDYPTTKGNLTQVEKENIMDFVWKTLPDGWEIDSGMNGEIAICLKSKTITLDINYQEEISETITFNFNGKPQLDQLTTDYKDYVEKTVTELLDKAKVIRYLTDNIWLPYPEIEEVSCTGDCFNFKFSSSNARYLLYNRVTLSNIKSGLTHIDWMSILNLKVPDYIYYGDKFTRPENPLLELNDIYERLNRV